MELKENDYPIFFETKTKWYFQNDTKLEETNQIL